MKNNLLENDFKCGRSFKNIYLQLIYILFFLITTAYFKGNTKNPGELAVGIDLTYAPYAYQDGGPRGFDPDLMRLIGEKLNLKVVFKDTRIENIIIGLNAGHYDIVASALYINPQRAEQVSFLPYLQTGGVLVVRKNEAYRPLSLNDLCGKKISSMKGASWIPRLNEISESYCLPTQSPIEVKEFPSAPEATQALISKGVDVQYEDAAVAKMLIDRLGGQLVISTKEMIDPVLIGLAFTKNNIELKEKVAQVLRELRESGEYQKLLDKYNLADPDPELIKQYHLEDNRISENEPVSGFNWSYLGGLFINKDFWNACLTVLELSTLTWFLSVISGFIIALFRQSDYKGLKKFAELYIWFFRSLPLLVLLIFVYNLPQVWPASSLLLSNPFISGLLALVLSETAYMAEIHRGALQAVPKGQYEAGKALGIPYFGVLRLIILPQTFRIALPSLANQYITIVKLTSLVSVISLTEILLVGQQLYTRNFLVMETLLAVSFYYVLIVTLITWLIGKLEKRLDVSKKEISIDTSLHVDHSQLEKYSELKMKKEGDWALEVKNLKKTFGSTEVLKDIDLSVSWGEIVSIIGASGSGKTTLIRSVNGLEAADRGEVWLVLYPIKLSIFSLPL